jgi:peptidoglycan hydrolase CwlO-like protein
MNAQVSPAAPAQHRYHFFISHASEDKESWAKPLQIELKELGCQVWIDDEQIEAGDNLIEQINEGLRESKYIVPIISRSWLLKKWSKAEGNAALYQTITRTVNDAHGRILPIRHGITQEALASEVPLLGPVLTLSTEMPVRRLAAALVRAISRPEQRARARTTVDLRALSSAVPEPDGVEALEYLRKVATTKPPQTVEAAPRTRINWAPILFFFVIAAVVAGASVTSRFNPKVRQLTSTLEAEQARITRLQTVVGDQQQQANDRMGKIADLERQLKEIEGARAALAAERLELQRKLDEMGASVVTRDKRIGDLTSELESERSRAAANLEAAGRGWQQKADDAARKIAELERRLKEAEDRRVGLETERQRIQQKLEETNRIVEARDKKILELSAQVGALSEDIKTLKQETQRLTSLLNEGEGKQKKSAGELAQLQTQKERDEEHLNKAQQTMEAKVNEWKKTAEKNAKLVVDLTTLKSQLAEAQSDALEKKTQLSQLRREVQALKNRPSGAKLVRLYANYANLHIVDDATATMDSENVQGNGGGRRDFQVSKPPGTEAVVLLLGCCPTVTAESPQQIYLAQPIPIR